MKISVIYDSHGGTTRAAAQAMQRLFSERGNACDVSSVQEADPARTAESDLICIGSWTQGLFVVGQHPTRATMEFVERLPELAGRSALVFCTYKLATGPLLPTLADALERRGADVVGRFAFRGPKPDASFSKFADRAAQRPKVLVAERESTWLKWPRKLMMAWSGVLGLQSQDPPFVDQLYRRWSARYDWSIKFDPAYPSGLQRTVRLVVRPGDRTLDFGCGTGLGTLDAASTAAEVVALDKSGEMLGRLEQKLRRAGVSNVRTVRRDLLDGIVDERGFDSALSSFAMVHLPSRLRRQVYASVHAALRPGGRLGLFAGRGEIVDGFETIENLAADLIDVGFERVTVRDIRDVYRIVTARAGSRRAAGEGAPE